jgi:hypothetical protein
VFARSAHPALSALASPPGPHAHPLFARPNSLTCHRSILLPSFLPRRRPGLYPHSPPFLAFPSLRSSDRPPACPCSVNTPTKLQGVGAGKAATFGFWEAAARLIASSCQGGGPKIVAEKSPVPVKTAQAMSRVSGGWWALPQVSGWGRGRGSGGRALPQVSGWGRGRGSGGRALLQTLDSKPPEGFRLGRGVGVGMGVWGYDGKDSRDGTA